VPDQRGQDGAIGPVQAGPGLGAAQYGDLMPQHQRSAFFDADERPSRTSQSQTRMKIR